MVCDDIYCCYSIGSEKEWVFLQHRQEFLIFNEFVTLSISVLKNLPIDQIKLNYELSQLQYLM